MQPKHNRRTQNSWSNILLLMLISLFSCIIGSVIGAGGLWYYEQMAGPTDVIATPQVGVPVVSLGSGGNAPAEDGFFLAIDGSLVKIPEFYDANEIDFSLLPTTSDKKPVFAIKGANYPLGSLKLLAYVAGIGVDADFTQAGAVINSVFENSPAQVASLQPGEMIVSVNGEPVRSPMGYVPGKKDLFGAMQEKITLVVMSGTNNRTVEIPRTYLGTVSSTIVAGTNPSIKFTLEPKGDHVLLHADRELKPGLYRFEFQPEIIASVGELFPSQPTSTPTQPPVPLPTQKWIFVVK